MDAEKIRLAATAHFKKNRSELKSLLVPEWGEEARVYFYPVLNVKEVEQIAPYIGVNSQTMNLVAFILCARDEAGSRLWSMAALDDIRNGTSEIDPFLINTIVDRMNVLSDGAEDEAKKP